MEKDFLEWWAILDENSINSEDYVLGSSLEEELDTITPDTPEYFYNQGARRRTRNWCTNYGALGCISDLTWYKFSDEEILEVHNLAEKEYWWNEEWWNYLYKAVDCARNWWNDRNTEDNQIISFRVDLLSETARRLEDAWKSIMIGYRTTREHYKDSQDNWKLDSESFAWAKKIWGHCIRKYKKINIDNYIWVKKYNSYENDKLVDYVKEGTYFRYWYVFFKKKESSSDLAKRLWFWNWKNPNSPATRFEVASMIGALYKKVWKKD